MSTFEIQGSKSRLCTKARPLFCIPPEPRLLAGMQPKLAKKLRDRSVQSVSSGAGCAFGRNRPQLSKPGARINKETAAQAPAAAPPQPPPPAYRHDAAPKTLLFFFPFCTTCSSSILQHHIPLRYAEHYTQASLIPTDPLAPEKAC